MRLKDKNGEPSTTLTFVAIAFVAVLFKYLLAGVIDVLPPMSATEFGGAVMTIIAPWVAREFKEKWSG
ncbi:MAG: hypothetical protein OEX12_15070 [Gammaproteobacteria bacterium]|nr:hypothetical protein [Gammaproteobacteria bacterium]